jgi:hypothetical protein
MPQRFIYTTQPGPSNKAYLSSPHLEASPATTFCACSSPAPTQVKPQPAPAILSQESVHTTLSITHHTRMRPSTGPRTTHDPQRVRAPAKQLPTRATPRSPRNTDLQCLRAVMMERSRQPRCPRPHLPRRPRLPRRSIPKLQRLQSHVKARERVSNSLTSSGDTSGECARAHPPRTRRIPSTPESSS